MNSKKQVLGISSSVILSLLIITVALNFQSLETQPSDIAKLSGWFILEHRDIDGNLVTPIQVHKNLITNEGMECIADLVFATTDCTAEAKFSYVAVGLTNTSPVDGDTALNSESGTCSRVQDATVDVDAAVTGQRNYTLISVFSGANCEGEAYVEGGIFDASSSGNMLATAIFSPSVTLSSGETLTITYNVTAKNT